MKLKKVVASLALGAGALYATVPLVYAQEDVIVVEAMHPTLYMNGGVGKSDEAYMRKIAKDFNLRLQFSERKDNEFVAGVNLAIADARGNTVFMLPSGGPMTDLMLADGKYRVSATYKGKTETQTVTLRGKEGKDLEFHWNGAVKIDPFDGKPMVSK